MKPYIFSRMLFVARYTKDHPDAMFWLTNYGYVNLSEVNEKTYILTSPAGIQFMVDLAGRAFAKQQRGSKSWEPFDGTLQPYPDCTCWEYIYKEAYLQNLTLPDKGTHRQYILDAWKQLTDIWVLRLTARTDKEESKGIKKILKISKIDDGTASIISRLTFKRDPPTLNDAVEFVYFMQNRT